MSLHALTRVGAAAIVGLLLPTVGGAHSFSTPYVLPIPFWIYLYGCIATLIVTFGVLGLLASHPIAPGAVPAQPRESPAWPNGSPGGSPEGPMVSWALRLLRIGAVFCLLLTILAGFVGSQDAGENIGMTLFWVIFLLGFAYLCLFLGDLYALLNPWQTLAAWIEKAGLDLSRARVRYPERLGAWPAVLFYMALIWIELFAQQTPLLLSKLLLAYSAITFSGVVLFGRSVWFALADPFSRYFAMFGKLTPFAFRGSPLVLDRPAQAGAVLFVLFMLSSTAYDAIYDSQLWTALFWTNAMTYLQPLWGSDLAKAQSLLMSSFLWYRKLGLLVFPFIYLGFYLLALFLAKALAGSAVTTRALARCFCYSLIPIAVAYHFSHYYTFLLSRFEVLPWLISDPLGRGWNLLSLDGPEGGPMQIGVIWHTQVIVILLGHVFGVVVSHQVARRVFTSRRAVLASQLPLLALMVAYTMVGLWILTLPLG